ncbi:MAG: DUF1700 domain-containing protein [Clostridia bacterium]|nr:DUF1700 domain-containing protein [Clostridia bacterium]
MTYTEWRDELKSNLLCVSESERRRVLEYYAEAYADRREAGFTEREIIAEFGAPYDAAQRILNEDRDLYEPARREEPREAPKRAEPVRDEYYSAPAPRPQPQPQPQPRVNETRRVEEPKEKKPVKKKTSWVFILLCVIFAVPVFMLILALSAMTVAAFFAPFVVLIAGVGEIGIGVGMMFSSFLEGLMRVGLGLILFGVGVILISILPRIARLIWTFFKKLGGFIKSLFTTEEA